MSPKTGYEAIYGFSVDLVQLGFNDPLALDVPKSLFLEILNYAQSRWCLQDFSGIGISLPFKSLDYPSVAFVANEFDPSTLPQFTNIWVGLESIRDGIELQMAGGLWTIKMQEPDRTELLTSARESQ